MADTPVKAPEGKSAFGFLGKKVFGKIPVWVIAVAAVGVYYVYEKRKKATASATQTDPAGNTCTAVNPATGYCPGTPEDQAAMSANAGGLDTTGSGADQSGSTGGGAGGTDTGGGTTTGTTGSGSTGTTGTTGTTDTGTGTVSWIDQSGQAQTGSPADFAAAFAATGSNAGDIVPGGTGQVIPLQPGQSYTNAGPAPSASAKPGAQNAHAQHLAHVAHEEHLTHVAATRTQPPKTPARG